MKVDSGGRFLVYKQGAQLEVLGELFDAVGSTLTSVEYMLSRAEAVYHKNASLLRRNAGVIARARAWAQTCQTSAVFGAESWHITSRLLHRMRTWELQHLRKVFRMKVRDGEGLAQFNMRTAQTIQKWLSCAKVQMLHERVITAIFRSASREVRCVQPCGRQPVREAREFRDAAWWGVAQMFDARMRASEGCVQSRQGHSAAWENPLVLAFGPTWRVIRTILPEWQDWNRKQKHFIRNICCQWHLPITAPRDPEVLLLDALIPKAKATLENCPSLVAHPDDQILHRSSFCLNFVVDCKVLADLLSGITALCNEEQRPLFIRLARDIASFHSKSWVPRLAVGNYVEWRPREYNGQADHWCNVAMDTRSGAFKVNVAQVKAGIAKGINVRLYSDGGARRGDGLAALAWIVYIGEECAGYSFSVLPGVRSSFVAESLALASAFEF